MKNPKHSRCVSNKNADSLIKINLWLHSPHFSITRQLGRNKLSNCRTRNMQYTVIEYKEYQQANKKYNYKNVKNLMTWQNTYLRSWRKVFRICHRNNKRCPILKSSYITIILMQLTEIFMKRTSSFNITYISFPKITKVC